MHIATQNEDARDTDEMDMSDDEPEQPRYGKRLRTESKVSFVIKLKNDMNAIKVSVS